MTMHSLLLSTFYIPVLFTCTVKETRFLATGRLNCIQYSTGGACFHHTLAQPEDEYCVHPSQFRKANIGKTKMPNPSGTDTEVKGAPDVKKVADSQVSCGITTAVAIAPVGLDVFVKGTGAGAGAGATVIVRVVGCGEGG